MLEVWVKILEFAEVGQLVQMVNPVLVQEGLDLTWGPEWMFVFPLSFPTVIR